MKTFQRSYLACFLNVNFSDCNNKRENSTLNETFIPWYQYANIKAEAPFTLYNFNTFIYRLLHGLLDITTS